MRFAGLLFRHGVANGWHRLIAPLFWLWGRRSGGPTRLLIAPQDIRTADPTVASDIYAGYFSFGGKIVNAHGRSPFEIDPPTEAWAETLQGFSWLRHMRAADTSLARANARALVEDWMANARQAGQAGWRPRVVARRILSWLSQSPVILDGADSLFYRRLMKSLGRQAAYLAQRLGRGLVGEDRLWAALALAELGICAESGASGRRGARAFVDELGHQFLGDGGHVSRNPGLLVELLLDLLPLRQAYAARGAEVPPPLLNVIDRLMPMLRMFRHPDGSLALFNGMGVSHPDALAIVLAYDDAHSAPLGNAPYSGYQRAEAGEAVLICDTGRVPPLEFSKQAHAGTLSFEFSPGPQRLIVNCGAPHPSRHVALQAARQTAAHSTLVLADRSSSHFVSAKRLFVDLDGALVAGPTVVPVTRQETEGEIVIEASHDGYAQQGFVHHRRWTLAAGGEQLLGEDRLVPAATGQATTALPFAIRFHLHPTARATFAADAGAVAIALPDDTTWLFEAGGLPIDVEESIYFANAEGPRRTEQLVVQASTADLSTVQWSFTRQGPG